MPIVLFSDARVESVTWAVRPSELIRLVAVCGFGLVNLKSHDTFQIMGVLSLTQYVR